MPTHSHYDVLQLDSANATSDEIKRAFRRLSMEHHPDKNGNSEESNRAFQEINEAYNVLSDPAKRNNYDFEQQMGIGGTTAHGIRMHHMGPMGMGHMHRRHWDGRDENGRDVPPFFAEWHRRAHAAPSEEKKE